MQMEQSTLHRMWRSLWLIVTFLLLFGCGAVFLKFYEDSIHRSERGRLVASIVKGQFDSIAQLAGQSSTQSAGISAATLSPASPDDSLELKKWVVERAFEDSLDPAALALTLDASSKKWVSSEFMQMSIRRWSKTLKSWMAGPSGTKQGSSRMRADQLLLEGRQKFFEASGLQKIGKSYDATVLHLWVVYTLTRFVEKAPLDPAVPEALFMLGESYLTLGRALPENIKKDRILNLCSELYPDSVWAGRANSVWKEDYGNAI